MIRVSSPFDQSSLLQHLNFEINGKGEIVPLGSNPVPLHERLQKRLDELSFKPYMDKNNPLGISDNSPNCTVGIKCSVKTCPFQKP